jgi:hypothetical protein
LAPVDRAIKAFSVSVPAAKKAEDLGLAQSHKIAFEIFSPSVQDFIEVSILQGDQMGRILAH